MLAARFSRTLQPSLRNVAHFAAHPPRKNEIGRRLRKIGLLESSFVQRVGEIDSVVIVVAK